MTLLLDPALRPARSAAVAGPLGLLAASLTADLTTVLDRGFRIPHQKARLTRAGGRCPRDGAMLEFDPWSAGEHRCSTCGTSYRGEAHDRAWTTWYQLWLAERAVHAAVLHLLCGAARHAAFAREVLTGYADQYLAYPNADNVLGPARPFFSTYLESIWLLQLCIALDALEEADADAGIGGSVRDRVIAPSRGLIASYDEGQSNRQVWNSAALLAAGVLLGDGRAAEAAVRGPSGVVSHLTHGLLVDGTWYEGENYHLFAHRGLWYGVTMAARLGIAVAPALTARFDEGFATPFVSALPDFTFPARRDSPYGVSLRQWRYAELAELGLTRRDDERLAAALAVLYAPDAPSRDTGRARSAAEAERNEPAARLTRADLGWRALLHARPVLPPLGPVEPRSALLEGQGIAIFRRDGGRLYAALDYGHSGGGHGHPDRLNVLLNDGAARWLDDPGTGSYVDRTLHWYRSTLAHNAPLAAGRSQRRVHGELRAFEERGGAGWVVAAARDIAPGLDVQRTLVVMAEYVVDEIAWTGDAATVIDLPLHVGGDLAGATGWRRSPLAGDGGLEDGYDFLTATERATVAGTAVHLSTTHPEGARLDVWCFPGATAEWWRATAPGPPGHGERRMHLLRSRGGTGTTLLVWGFRGAIRGVEREATGLAVTLADGSRHRHTRGPQGWHVALESAGCVTSVGLGGARAAGPAAPDERGVAGGRTHRARAAPRLVVAEIQSLPPLGDSAEASALPLGKSHYRRSELAWEEAGAPRAFVTLRATGGDLVVDIHVEKADVFFAPAREENDLDNEHPDVNSDGVQLYVLAADAGGAVAGGGWLIVPEPGGGVRAHPVVGWPATFAVRGEWRRTMAGFALRLLVPGAARRPQSLRLDVVVNETTPARERRRGQLVLSGGAGEVVYLRGDRHDPGRLLPVAVADG